MTAPLLDQLRQYGTDFEDGVEPILIDEIGPPLEDQHTIRPLAVPARARRPAWLAVTIAAAGTVLVVGGTAALVDQLTPTEPAVSTPTTVAVPTTLSTPTTPVGTEQSPPTTSVATESAPPFEPARPIEPSSVHRNPGSSVVWTELVGTASGLPVSIAIRAAENGSFVASDTYELDADYLYEYRSPDGISWSVTAEPVPVVGSNLQAIDTGIDTWLWTTAGLFRPVVNGWRQVEVPDGRASVAGLVWSAPIYTVRVTDTFLVVGVNSHLRVDWSGVYGATSEETPSVRLTDEERFFSVVDPDTEEELGVFRVDIRSMEPLDVVFTDASTGDVVHSVSGENPGITTEEFLQGIDNSWGFGLIGTDLTWWVSNDDGESFREFDTPWDSTQRGELSHGLGGVVYATNTDSGVFEWWRTSDGETFEHLPEPAFTQDIGSESHLSLDVVDGRLRAAILKFAGNSESTILWESTDGESWTRLGEMPGTNLRHTDLGWVAVGDSAVYVSQDLATWERLDSGPIADPIATEERFGFDETGFAGGAVAAGDAIFYSLWTDDVRILWVGKIER